MEARVAYFSAEFGIDSSLPIYSGGLGVLAGDHIKASHDLKIPLIGVGIFYRKGYFQQRISASGQQEAVYDPLSIEQMPIDPVVNEHGQRIIINVTIADRQVALQAWVTTIGGAPVYLLDADFEQNEPADRRLTDHLYGGGQEGRIAQEIILGIGGARLLQELQIEPDVWHMNEGHSAFLALERIRVYSAQGISFETALEAVKASAIFTTHTPVPAGHDQFSFELMDRYLGSYYWQLGTTRETILQLGEMNGCFNMTRLAVSTCSQVNGVSKLHAEVTKELFHDWTPQIPADHIPMQAVTNGIHTGTWLAAEVKQLFDRYLDSDWEVNIKELETWKNTWRIPDEELWDARRKVKRRMIDALDLPFNENTLVIGFARRFATYKRALLFFRDLDRLERILNQQDRQVAILLAGKAHPADQPGQELIRQIWEISQTSAFKDRVILMENYDMAMAKHLVAGVDVWLNTPTKPMEASGTSGQKAAVNGVLNFSVLDGWWPEGFNGKNGWAIEGDQSGDREIQDQIDGETLYHILEHEIVPLYFGNPSGWAQMMKESIQTLGPAFSASRMVADYWEKLYVPTANRGRRFTADGLEIASRMAAYKQFIRANWNAVKIDQIELIPSESEQLSVRCQVHLGEIWRKDVSVEAVGSLGWDRGVWTEGLQFAEEVGPGVYSYTGVFSGSVEEWFEQHANIRVMPISPDFVNDYELELATWG
ncbi:alpha-glucan phosphorylase [Ammoniphilus oxalaticus]|uniref:Alpha-glucan phosphorylase n=1 Tax=Ammoniphilus oxalaticus TaxID=66863 RepID=A0A419SGN2_9BACL|nr:alpha-glucan family phosphorylase [Ammoniphilus oxalaticus]RKD22961.1 alpha-glucan phosphorylase [Ammoniphilus oxalaticus]